MNINTDSQTGFARLEEFIRGQYPQATDLEIRLIKQEVKCICTNMIHNIGNSVNILTNTIEL